MEEPTADTDVAETANPALIQHTDCFPFDVLRDDTYDALWNLFVSRKAGKGRPPSLPSVSSTNRLINPSPPYKKKRK